MKTLNARGRCLGRGCLCFGFVLAPALLADGARGDDCNPSTTCQVSRVPAGPQIFVGDTVRVSCDIGPGSITGGVANTMEIPAPQDPANPVNPNPLFPVALRFALDCVDGNLGGPANINNCVDEGNILSFQGNVTTDCPGVTSVGAAVGGNLVSFTLLDGANLPISTTLPANTTCNLSWNTQVVAFSTDATPNVIQAARTWAGQCDQMNPLFADGTGTVAIPLSMAAVLPAASPVALAALGTALAGLLAWHGARRRR